MWTNLYFAIQPFMSTVYNDIPSISEMREMTTHSIEMKGLLGFDAYGVVPMLDLTLIIAINYLVFKGVQRVTEVFVEKM